MTNIKHNLKRLKDKLPDHVTLIAVSKTKNVSAIREAYDAGQLDFGENYVQELTDKHDELPKDIRWHFIGHLQSNKVKYIAPFVYLIHGVDSFKLLKEINKQAEKFTRHINCLLQVHIAEEESKFGFSYSELEELFSSDQLNTLSHIHIKGFMAMATNTSNIELIRSEFNSLAAFANKYPQYNILSFGMSSDYKLAIECGSNMIRVGSLIFGERDYSSK